MAVLTGQQSVGRAPRAMSIAAAVVFAIFVSASNAGAQRAASIDEVKAAFVYQFANYITWPSNVFPDDTAPFNIGIVGNSTVAELLRESVRDKDVGGRPVLVREVEGPEEAATCQIVFLDHSDDKRVDDYLAALTNKPVLTVSDDNNFTEEGGIIKLYEEQKKLRIEINVDESARSKLEISSKLLGLAKVVRDRS